MVDPTETLTPTSLADEIAFRLERGILEGEYRPGTHLLQDELCTRFGVSRTPVREALRKLQAQHLLVLTPNKGATVRVPSRIELEEIYTVRAELEGFASELAAGRALPEGIARLQQAQTVIEAANELLDRDRVEFEHEGAFNAEITRGNEDFHDAIFRMAGNQQLRQLCQSLQTYFPKDYVWRAIRTSSDRQALNVEDHRVIVAAIEAKAGKRARSAMSQHIRRGGDRLIAYLADRGFWDHPATDPSGPSPRA